MRKTTTLMQISKDHLHLVSGGADNIFGNPAPSPQPAIGVTPAPNGNIGVGVVTPIGPNTTVTPAVYVNPTNGNIGGGGMTINHGW